MENINFITDVGITLNDKKCYYGKLTTYKGMIQRKASKIKIIPPRGNLTRPATNLTRPATNRWGCVLDQPRTNDVAYLTKEMK